MKCDACDLEVVVEPVSDDKIGFVTVPGDPNTLWCIARDRKRYHVVEGRTAPPWSNLDPWPAKVV